MEEYNGAQLAMMSHVLPTADKIIASSVFLSYSNDLKSALLNILEDVDNSNNNKKKIRERLHINQTSAMFHISKILYESNIFAKCDRKGVYSVDGKELLPEGTSAIELEAYGLAELKSYYDKKYVQGQENVKFPTPIDIATSVEQVRQDLLDFNAIDNLVNFDEIAAALSAAMEE